MKFIDLTGQKFGRLTVIERAENKGKQTMWLCKCECGNTSIVQGGHLRNETVKSCGCLLKDNSKTHGHCYERIYHIWEHMKQRCCNPNDKRYRLYGAEGKEVCSEWNDFQAFYDWAMSNGYADNLTIDRIDNNKGYSPDNCRWTDKKTQNNNTRQNCFITYNGKTQTVAQWADEYGIKYNTLWSRLDRGWNINRALSAKKGAV